METPQTVQPEKENSSSIPEKSSQQAPEAVKLSCDVSETLEQNLGVLKEDDQQCGSEHQVEEELRCDSQVQTEKGSLTTHLDIEQTQRHLDNQPPKQVDAHVQESEALKESVKQNLDIIEHLHPDLAEEDCILRGTKSLEERQKLEKQKLVEQQSNDETETRRQELVALKKHHQHLVHRPQVKEELSCKGDQFSSNLETGNEMNVCLKKREESLMTELEKERTWRLRLSEQLGRLRYTHQQSLEAVKQSSRVTDAIRRELKALKEDYQQLGIRLQVEMELRCKSQALANRLSVNLETENKNNESLTKDRNLLSTELEIEHKNRLELKDQLEKQRLAHQEALETLKQPHCVTEALHRELETLKKANLELSTKLQIEEELRCQALMKRLSVSREAETTKNRCLSNEKDSLCIQLQEEQSWRLLEKAAHQETLVAVKEALHLELEDLNEVNKQLFTQLKAEEELRSKSEAFTTRLSHDLETEFRKNQSLTKEKEYLAAELEKERTCRLHLSDELQKQKNTHLQETESLKESTSEKLQSLERLNCELSHVIKTEKNVNAILRRDSLKVSVALEAQVKKNSNLLKLRDSDKAELQKEQSWRLNVQNQLEAVKQSSRVTEALRLELDALKEGNNRLASKLQIEKEHRCVNKALTEKLVTSLETEVRNNEALTEEKEFLSMELEKEQTWRLQLNKRMKKQKLTYMQALETFKQFRALAQSLCQELDALRATYQKLSSKVMVEEELKSISLALTDRLTNNLETEANMNESLTKEKLSLSVELEKEQVLRMQLSDQLEKQRLAHQEVLEAVKQYNVELEAMKDANEQLSTQLQVQDGLTSNCQTESFRLHQDLEAEIQKNESLTKEKDCLTVRLENEQTLSAQLNEQVQEQKDALQEAEAKTKSADEKLKCLEKLNSELSHSIKAEKDVNGTLRGDTFRLSFALQTQTTKNEYLSKQREYDAEKFQKEQAWRLQVQDQLEKQKLAHQQVLDELKKQSDVTEALCSELKVLKEANQCLTIKLQVEEELRGNTQGLNDQLSADLKTEVTKNGSLVEVNISLTAELEKERTWRLQLSDQLDALKHAHQNTLGTLKQSDDVMDATQLELEALKEAHQHLFSKLKVEEEVRCDLQALRDRLSINLDTEMKKNVSLTKEKETLNSRLEEEQQWSQQLSSELERQKLTYEDALKQSSKVNEVPQLDSDAMKEANKLVATEFQVEEELRGNSQASNDRLSTNLEAEKTKNESLTSEKETLTIEQGKKQTKTERWTETGKKLDTSNSDQGISHETKVLRMKLKPLHVKLQEEMDFPGKMQPLTDRLSNNLETTQKESLSAELEKEKTWRRQLSDELDRQKLAHQQLLESVKQTNDVTEALHWELKVLKEAHQQVSTKLQAEEELRRLSQALNERLSNNLESEKQINSSLVTEKESLAAKLDEEHTWRLQLSDDLKKQKECHLQESEAMKKSTAEKVENLERKNSDLDYSFRTEKDINTALREDAVRLSIALETQIAKNENLSKWIKCNVAELHKEQKWRFELQNQLEREKLSHQQEIDAVHRSSDELFNKLQVKERLRCESQALSDKLLVNLKTEIQKNKSLTKEKEFLMAELEEEQARRLQLSDQLERHKEVHLHGSRTLRQELDSMEKRNSELNQSLKTQKKVNTALRDDAKRLSSALESKISSNKTLSQQRDYYIDKLQEELTWRQQVSKECERLKSEKTRLSKAQEKAKRILFWK